jgi:tape measure domain-containing protein
VSVVANIAINIDAKNAQATLAAIEAKVKELNGSFDQVKAKSSGAGASLGSAFTSALGPLLTLTTAVTAFQKVTSDAFDRAGAEQRIKALSSAYGEQTQVLALASEASRKFGITQTEASTAIADVYGRLRPLGLGLSEINSVYEGFNVVARQSGLSATESSSVFTQLAQALGSGVLRGDEFNRMAESMPGILGLVAEQLNVSQGALRGMAADGLITGDVVVKALQQAQQSAGDLTKYMTPAQIAMNDLSRNAQEVSVQLGNMAAPVYTAGLSLIGVAAEKAANFFKYVNDQLLSVLPASTRVAMAFGVVGVVLEPLIKKLDVSVIAKTWTGALVTGIRLTVSAIQLIGPAVGFAIDRLAQLPTILGTLQRFIPALKVIGFVIEKATAATKLLMDYFIKVGAEVDKYTAKQDAATKKAVDQANASRGMSDSVAAAAEKTAQLTAGLSAAKDQALAGKYAIEGQIAALERGNRITQARYGAEQALNELKGVQLEREMSLATTAQQRANIAVAMFNQQLKAAQIEYQMALEAIKLDQQKQQLAIDILKLKYQEIDAEGKLQALKDSKNEERIAAKTKEALDSQREAIKLAEQNLETTKQTAAYQEQTAAAVYKTKVVQAQLKLESQLTSEKIGMSQQNAASLSNSLASGVGQARGLAGAMGQVAANAGSAANAMQQVINNQSRMQNLPVSSTNTANLQKATYANGSFYEIKYDSSKAAMTKAEQNAVANPEPSRIVAYYAKGGFVSKATNAMIGEAGPEYVVPASKAANFASNYLSGMRGNAAVQSKTASSAASYLSTPRNTGGGGGGKAPAISIQTGPVTQMDGVNYVTTQDMARAVQSGVRQTLNMLRNDSSARRVVGMA